MVEGFRRAHSRVEVPMLEPEGGGEDPRSWRCWVGCQTDFPGGWGGAEHGASVSQGRGVGREAGAAWSAASV
jgi:hypothetical protein